MILNEPCTWRGDGCQSRTPFPLALGECHAPFSTACNSGNFKNPVLGMAAALKTPSRHPENSFWACASQAVLDPLPYVCGLTSFAAVHLVPPWCANINKVTCTSTPCLSSSLQPALTLPKYDRYVLACMPCSDVPAPVVTLLLARATSRLPRNQHESPEVVLQSVTNKMS